MIKFFLVLSFVFFTSLIFAQNVFLVSGYIKDKTSGESIIGATIKSSDNNSAVISNSYGFYSYKLPKGNYTLYISFVGYLTDSIKVNLSKNQTLNITLNPETNQLQEVVVQSTKENYVQKISPGFEKFSVTTLKKVPLIFGESDIIKTLQLLPGVKSISEGSSGLSVRGGTDVQNLYLLDEATVYNPSHFGGLFSSFNSDALKDLQLYKGYAPAKFGGRLSSVLDIKMKDGNNQGFHGEGGIGLISSRLTLQGPFQKNQSSWIVSGRRTYFDIFTPLGGSAFSGVSLYFYDLNAKANFNLNEKTKLYVSGYFGQDRLALNSLIGINWGNQTLTLRLNRIIKSNFFSNTSLIYSNYDYLFSLGLADISFNIKSLINDWNIKQDFEYYVSNRSKFYFGAYFTYHNISPGAFQAQSTVFNIVSQTPKYQKSLDYGAYFQHEYIFNKVLAINYGVRINIFQLVGPYDYYLFDADGNVTDTLSTKTTSIIRSYFSLEPRIALNFSLSKKSIIKVAYSRNSQNLHLLSNSNVATPADLWISNSPTVQPEYADEFSIGYYTNLWKGQLEFSVETYYKYLQNQIGFRPGAVLRGNDLVEGDILSGHGRAYGLEFFLRKKTGKLTGWISYTLARTERQIAGINAGSYFPASQNRTHEVSIVANYEFNKKWTVASNLVYYTGNAATYPSGKYEIQNGVFFSFPDINSFNLPYYNRVDVSAVYNLKPPKKNKKLTSNLAFGVYNILGRLNPFSIAFVTDPKNPNITYAEQTSLFQFVPYLTWNFKF